MKFLVPETYRKTLGTEFQIEIREAASLRSIIANWPEALRKEVFGHRKTTDDRILSRFLFFRENRILRLDDEISDQDIIKILLTATGG